MKEESIGRFGPRRKNKIGGIEDEKNIRVVVYNSSGICGSRTHNANHSAREISRHGAGAVPHDGRGAAGQHNLQIGVQSFVGIPDDVLKPFLPTENDLRLGEIRAERGAAPPRNRWSARHSGWDGGLQMQDVS
jgi:hypothetical protein